MTGAIRSTSREKLYQELCLEPVRLRRWYKKTCRFYKVFKNELPQLLYHLIPVRYSSHTSRNIHNIPNFNVKHSFSKTLSLLLLSLNGKKLGPGIRNSRSLSIFRKKLLHFIRPTPNSIYNCHNPKRVELITGLRLWLYSLIQCPVSTLSSLDGNLLDNTDCTLKQTLLFDNMSFKSNKNLKILITTTDYILSSKRFDEPQF